MKKSEIKPALEALKKIKMPKIEDKELRNLIIEDHFTLLSLSRRTETKLEDARKVAFADLEEDQRAIEELNRKFQGAETDEERRAINREINSHEDYFKALEEYRKLIEKENEKEVKGLTKIDRTKFMKELDKQDYTLELVEGLYPLFTLGEEEKEPTKEKSNKSSKK